MPFKSKAQVGKIAELEKEGKVKKGTFKEFSKNTPNMKALPQRVSKSKPKSLADVKAYAEKKYGKK